MKFFSTIIEQLDMAIAEIGIDQPINSRLALILIDNATELLIHRSCEQYAARGAGKDKIPLSPTMRRDATGDHFEPKLAVMRHIDAITEDERRFIAIAHAYRNELYHVGLRHEEVLRPIAQNYFQLTCAFLPRMGLRSIGWGPDFKLNERVKRYVPNGGGPGSMAFHHRVRIAAALLAALPSSAVSSGMSLKTDLMHRIGRIENTSIISVAVLTKKQRRLRRWKTSNLHTITIVRFGRRAATTFGFHGTRRSCKAIKRVSWRRGSEGTRLCPLLSGGRRRIASERRQIRCA